MIINVFWKKVIFDCNFYRKIINRKIEYRKLIIKTRNRNIVISNYLLDSIIKVYNGRKYIPVVINNSRVGYRLKDFLYTVNRHKFLSRSNYIKKWQK